MADKETVDLRADFDALLRRTLAVEPSPEFLARVRERVAEERRSSRWMSPWMLAAAATAATLAVAIGVPVLRGTPVASPEPPAAPALRMASVERPLPELPTIQRAASPGARRVAVRSTRGAGESPVAPVVIVDQRQRAALNTLVRMVEEGRLTEGAFAQTVTASSDAIEELLPIAVAPVAVSPIPVGGVLHNELERN